MKHSAGILIYRFNTKKQLEIFLVHNGGPFFKNKDDGFWSIPKGEIETGEKTENDIFKRAIKEVQEETGIILPQEKNKYGYLGTIKQKNAKIVHAYSTEFNWHGLLKQNIIEIEYPYKSGKKIKIPEVDKAVYFTEEKARQKINSAQVPFIDQLKESISFLYKHAP